MHVVKGTLFNLKGEKMLKLLYFEVDELRAGMKRKYGKEWKVRWFGEHSPLQVTFTGKIKPH